MQSAIRRIAGSDTLLSNSLLWEMGLTINREKTGFLPAEFPKAQCHRYTFHILGAIKEVQSFFWGASVSKREGGNEAPLGQSFPSRGRLSYNFLSWQCAVVGSQLRSVALLRTTTPQDFHFPTRRIEERQENRAARNARDAKRDEDTGTPCSSLFFRPFCVFFG